jgi:hypothetical protein
MAESFGLTFNADSEFVLSRRPGPQVPVLHAASAVVEARPPVASAPRTLDPKSVHQVSEYGLIFQVDSSDKKNGIHQLLKIRFECQRSALASTYRTSDSPIHSID